jgi:integrase
VENPLEALITEAVKRALAEQPSPVVEAADMPHFHWIGTPKPHNKKWRIYYREAGDSKRYKDFPTEAEANQWRAGQPLLNGGHPIGLALADYLASRTGAASTLTTLRYRIESVIQDRTNIPAEAFPWVKAWKANVAASATDTQVGTLSALRGFVKWLRAERILRTDPTEQIQITGRKKRGKRQGRVDEAKKLVQAALAAGDPAALALVTALTFGTRPGEVVNLRCRDLDASGSILWIEGEKTGAAKRSAVVPEEMRQLLQACAAGRKRDDFLFTWSSMRKRSAVDIGKARRDSLNRRLSQLCADVGLERLTAHSLRGMHTSFARAHGATAADVIAMIGHDSYATTRRHYVAPGVDEARADRAVAGLLFSAVPHAEPTGTAADLETPEPCNYPESCEDRDSNPNRISPASTSSLSRRWN